MFTNLIESDSHRKEFKRRSSFFLATIAGYSLILFAAGIVGIFTYDAQVEAQASSLELLEWIPPVKPVPERDTSRATQPTRRPRTATAPVDANIRIPVRTNPTATVDDPLKVPDKVGIVGPTSRPVTGPVNIGIKDLDPPGLPAGTPGTCLTCNNTQPTVVVENETPPTPARPTIRNVSTTVLVSQAISLPKPAYPILAKQIRAQGPVNVQILIDESGKVISARAVKGNPALIHAAEEAARRARFTPTLLNQQPVKVQGVIIYNFVLQ
jgi:protein TonB